ncbi:hypothetical protein [Spongiimicrobium sp. 2-473A-2-J]|uniref:hypothetical protein n=1 Tax=Eudoraea algarum TaxID=3417568 RepID=UPI003D35C663
MDLINCVDLSNESDYQNIYSSQLYGTFFMVYAKFSTETCDGGYKIKSITLRLLNYKGPINLGITRAKLVRMIHPDATSVLLKIEVQALQPSNVDVTVDVARDMECSIGGVLQVVRGLKSLGSDFVGEVFENEFKYREGFEKSSNGDIEPVSECREPEPENNYDMIEDGVQFDDIKGGYLCPESTNRVVR